MKKTAKGNMYTVTLDSTWEIFEQNLEGSLTGVFLVTYTNPPSEAVLQAMHATAKSLGYGESGATFASLRIEPAAQLNDALEAIAAVEDVEVAEPVGTIALAERSGTAEAKRAAVAVEPAEAMEASEALEAAEARGVAASMEAAGSTTRALEAAGAMTTGAAACPAKTFRVTPEMLLDPVAIFSLVEGLDPLVVVILDSQAASLLGATYKQDVLLERAGQLFGRPSVAFADFAAHLEDPGAKQRAWHLLKTLPKYEGK